MPPHLVAKLALDVEPLTVPAAQEDVTGATVVAADIPHCTASLQQESVWSNTEGPNGSAAMLPRRESYVS